MFLLLFFDATVNNKQQQQLKADDEENEKKKMDIKRMGMCKWKGTAIQRNAKSDENEDLFERMEGGLVDWQIPSQREGKRKEKWRK